MKKFAALLLAGAMAFSMMACGSSSDKKADDKSSDSKKTESAKSTSASDIKVGVIYIGDENEGYTEAHMKGIQEMKKELGLSDDQIIEKTLIPEDETCYDAAVDLAEQGCNIIFGTSFGHESYLLQAAAEYPDVQFCHATGYQAASSGLDNMHNYFTAVYESRYVSGVVAGLKLKEILEDGTLTTETQPDSFDADGNVKVGYVGAFSYAEVVSGYTAFYLGIKSVVPNVVMEVKYTNSWFDIDKEGAAAEALIANGCVIIGQHADSTGAPAATQKLHDDGKICYSVGYNIDMLETAPTAALTSATNNWAVYYKHAIATVMGGGDLEQDWSAGYNDDAVGITELGESCAEGTADYVADIESKLKDGSLQVFDTSTFTVGGEEVTSAPVDLSFMDYTTDPATVVYQGETVEAIEDGHFAESTFRSAPYFTLRIDGITEDADAVE